MYPVVFRIGSFEVTSFGVMVAAAVLAGLWLFGRELRRSNLPEHAADAALWGALAGLLGAKVLWTIEHAGEEPVLSLLLSRGGMSWFGGLVGGVGVGLLVMRHKRLPIVPVLAASTPALALGHAIGRVGCFLVGDDYGRPTDVPWGVAFPEGLPPTAVPVHPTQLYEALALVALMLVLIRWRRNGVPDASVLGRYLIIAGAIRFAIEFLRVNVRLVGPLTLAHMIAAGLMIAGLVLIVRSSVARRDEPKVASR